MFTRLDIKGYQTHSSKTLRLEPGINTITGPTDAGKSAVLRALAWACGVGPGGAAAIRHGEKRMAVRVTTDAGNQIIRKRSKAGMAYELDGKAYRATGKGVPEIVTQVINVAPVCFAEQLEAPYALSLSPAQLARELAEIVDLKVLDEVRSNASRAYRSKKGRREVAEEEAREARVAYAQGDGIEEAQEAYAVAEELYERVSTAAKKLSALRKDLARARSHLEAKRALAGVSQLADKTLKFASRAESAEESCRRIASLLKTAKRARAATLVPPPKWTPVEEANRAVKQINAKLKSLRNVIARATIADEKECEARKALEEIQLAMPDLCPTCGRPTTQL